MTESSRGFTCQHAFETNVFGVDFEGISAEGQNRLDSQRDLWNLESFPNQHLVHCWPLSQGEHVFYLEVVHCLHRFDAQLKHVQNLVVIRSTNNQAVWSFLGIEAEHEQGMVGLLSQILLKRMHDWPMVSSWMTSGDLASNKAYERCLIFERLEHVLSRMDKRR